MKIARIDTQSVKVPYTFGGDHKGEGLRTWTTNNILLVRVETDNGIVGWGEAFCYACTDAVRAAVHNMIAPIAIGQDARDIAKLSYDLQQKLHLFGRYGITIFALSGLDIALWDIAGKAAGLPLHRLLGGAGRDELPAYASLLKYRDPEKVAARTKQAVEEGYRHIKLHETEEPEVKAARLAAGNDVAIMVDTNCPWTPEQARHMTLKLRQYDLHWLEEPIFPPEDFAAIARLREGTGVPMAAGENNCTSFQFRDMFAAVRDIVGGRSATAGGARRAGRDGRTLSSRPRGEPLRRTGDAGRWRLRRADWTRSRARSRSRCAEDLRRVGTDGVDDPRISRRRCQAEGRPGRRERPPTPL